MVDDTTVVNFNSAIYGLRAIKKAAHKFQNQLFVLIKQHGSSNEVQLISNACCKSFDTLVREFCNEVLDQELRDRVAQEMAGIRCLLFTQLFSKTSLAHCA